MSTFPPR
ncbi:Muscle M-line assembly protein unc-89, partial [Danaus plexippus plexippus]